MPGASVAAGFNDPLFSVGSVGVVSDGYEVLDPKLKKKPVYDHTDLPGLGPDDIVRIGEDGKCYTILSDGRIRLYRKPSSFATKATNECLNQFI